MTVCKGCYELNTACGKCPRCIESALELVPKLIEEKRNAARKWSRIIVAIPPKMPHTDFFDHHKARRFDEARDVIYDNGEPS